MIYTQPRNCWPWAKIWNCYLCLEVENPAGTLMVNVRDNIGKAFKLAAIYDLNGTG